MTAVNLGLDPIYYATDHCDAIMDAADELRDALRKRAQEIVEKPYLLDEAMGEWVGIEARGVAMMQALSGRVTTLRQQASEAAALYALSQYRAKHGEPDPRVLDKASIGGWAPELPEIEK